MASSAGQKRRVGSRRRRGLDQGQPLGERPASTTRGVKGASFSPEATAGGGGFAPAPPVPGGGDHGEHRHGPRLGGGEHRRSSQWPSKHQQGRTEQRQQNFHREHLRPMLCAKGAGGTCPGRFISPASASGTGRCRRLHTGPPLRGCRCTRCGPRRRPPRGPGR